MEKYIDFIMTIIPMFFQFSLKLLFRISELQKFHNYNFLIDWKIDTVCSYFRNVFLKSSISFQKPFDIIRMTLVRLPTVTWNFWSQVLLFDLWRWITFQFKNYCCIIYYYYELWFFIENKDFLLILYNKFNGLLRLILPCNFE